MGRLLCNFTICLVPEWQVLEKCFLFSHTGGVWKDVLNLSIHSEFLKVHILRAEKIV